MIALLIIVTLAAVFFLVSLYACASVCGRNRSSYENEEQWAYIQDWKERHKKA